MKGEGYAIKNCAPEINQERNDYRVSAGFIDYFLISV